ncbi:hypothetical protein PHYBLDRAFT_133910 [Phycomyces blakesleeanus NRRL 1555(-)]|uniref:NADH:flavin oxidoreductase/NADH oxidase N-terminal domain-containing protein n=1 Tax=Phycomyces blakesleeanus (strain ATCC 8743b / DSM 1359 / FGSC 10004 / NBRC 33097 / NRRL 1555) TaxID=763407 RepID=A0A167MFJ9_PHYB8|nr:hypothetical protein PHYBLDRAFT_133910 [Phycomyces blakesleeanus NRRL 1555(-)]OAD72716.1 hypothetical protein PHYBLDRAFT_133910 [Phycomyces blakesleeanus NRRL 1555(-)]|eukprot:XP_018290756.1 hypothetical protein PHYBLDRAFT_133910 [Phycomyces blakesleeanus NRRL 1555(-)]
MPTALFTPIKVGSSLLRHRIVMSPLTRLRADADHVPVPLTTEYYQQRASEGGLLVAEATFIAEDAGVYPSAPGIYNDKQIEAWKNVTKAVHDKGGSIYLQLWHVGRATVSAWIPGSKLPVSASAIAINGKNTAGMDYEVPRVLAVEEISQITQTYADAAKNAISAGFDGVEIHGANGYLIDQFINTSSNIRTDQYGGSIENRTRFALEVVEGVSKAIGEERTAIRLSPWSGFQDMKDDTPYETWGYLVNQLQERHPRLAYLHFIEPRDQFINDGNPTADRGDAPFRKAWKGPFITAGGYTTTPKRAFETTEKLENTLVAFGRSFIANPDLPLRLKNDWPLNKYDRSTFYTSGSVGYTDYPYYNPGTARDIKN